ncbi:hypothetical protein [Cohaesibacter haloalkalitolerans]|uniref:hypothetical protein n=1 Tax=Cohaesibacter haloalkalitolerans TaxID=1162980 RepID=UPI000E6492B9|nr:hypothetical protein [Cohaesibacter haloalkalitolerans]
MTYIVYHLELLWAFVRGKSDALYGIDATRRGFWRSFMAILLVEPLGMFYALLFGYLDEVLLFRSGGFPLYLLQLFLDWGLPAILLFALLNLLGYRDSYIPLMVSYNWLNVIMVVITILPGALMTAHLIPVQLAVLLMLAIYGFAMWIAYRLYSFVLQCPPFTALGLSILMMIVGIASAFWLQSISHSLLVVSG